MKKLKYIILLFLCMATSLQMKAVGVTLTTDENVNRPAGIYNAERNLAAVLTEINRAQKAHVPVTCLSTIGALRLISFRRSCCIVMTIPDSPLWRCIPVIATWRRIPSQPTWQ